MARFCEECGAPLSSGARYCESCGAKVEAAAPVPPEGAPLAPIGFCAEPAWADRLGAVLSRGHACETGILYTHSTRLCARLGIGPAELFAAVDAYRETCARWGVSYLFVDAARNAVSSTDSLDLPLHLALLRAFRARMRKAGVDPRYLLILGGDEIVPVGVFPNRSHDPDEEIESDLPFSTLSAESPWEGTAERLVGDLLVGRLPTSSALPAAGADRPVGSVAGAPVLAYFANRAAAAAGLGRLDPAGVAAEIWEGSARAVFGQLGRGKLLISPETSLDNLPGRFDFGSNLAYFNVHGSDRTPFWYGQAKSPGDPDQEEYPRVFSPEEPRCFGGGFVIGSEACYGADLREARDETDSILLSALSNGCLAFVGSSRIAYGAIDAPARLADLIVLGFLKGIQEGRTAGEALREARLSLATDRGLDDCTVKTLMEFALYGDPALRLAPAAVQRPSVPMPDIRVPSVDVRAAVATELAAVNEAIAGALEDFVRERHAGFASASPTFFRMRDSIYQAVYELPEGSLGRVLKIYFDERGRVLREYRSR